MCRHAITRSTRDPALKSLRSRILPPRYYTGYLVGNLIILGWAAIIHVAPLLQPTDKFMVLL